MEYDVFISYSRKDSEVVERIYKALDAAGLKCFIDLEGISGGADFPEVLASAIMDSKVFLFVASENSYASEYTLKEITYAVSKKGSRFIFPIIIDDSPLPQSLDFLLSNINWRKLTTRYGIEKEFVADVKKKLEDKHAGETIKQRERNTVKRLVWIISIVMVIIISLVGVSLWQTAMERAAKNRMEEIRVASRQEIKAALGWVERADSLDSANGITASYLQQKECLDSADACLNRSKEIVSVYPEDVLEDTRNGFTDVARSRSNATTSVQSHLKKLRGAITHEAILVMDLYEITLDEEDRQTALAAVQRVLDIFPDDEQMRDYKQILSN